MIWAYPIAACAVRPSRIPLSIKDSTSSTKPSSHILVTRLSILASRVSRFMASPNCMASGYFDESTRGNTAVNGFPVISITSRARTTRRTFSFGIASPAAGSSFESLACIASPPIFSACAFNFSRTSGSVSGKFKSSSMAFI